MKSDLVDVTVTLKRETDKAVLVDHGGDECWLPKSLIEIEQDGKAHIVTLPEWLAQEKGMI